MLWYTLWVLANTRRFALQMIDEMLMQMYFNIVSTYEISVRHICWNSGNLISHCVIFVLSHTIYKDTKDLQVNGSILCQSRSWPKIKIQYKWTHAKGSYSICLHKECNRKPPHNTCQHSFLNFGFFIYHVFMQTNKFSFQC